MSGDVVVFAKYPRPGRVKTRLIGPLTAEQAAEVHRRCFDLTMKCVAKVPGVRCVLAATPDNADFSGMVGGEVAIVPQGPGDLGERLGRVIAGRFGGGCDRLVAVGCDCPLMGPGDLIQALGLLARHDVVIGPATDGGYYLLGMSGPSAVLFTSIDWGSSRVADQTRDRAREAGLTVALLSVRRDVDEYDDLLAAVAAIGDDDERLGEFKQFLQGLLADGDNRGSARRSDAP
jgi:hypothetical protein